MASEIGVMMRTLLATINDSEDPALLPHSLLHTVHLTQARSLAATQKVLVWRSNPRHMHGHQW